MKKLFNHGKKRWAQNLLDHLMLEILKILYT